MKKAKPAPRKRARGPATPRPKSLRSQGNSPSGDRPFLRRDRQKAALERAKLDPEVEPEGPPPERRERRSLSHVGGRIEIRGGDAALRDALETALDVSDDDDASRDHVHGFHSYAARLHPVTARRLVERLSAPGETVLDPFMGSGTVLVEARLLGRRALGADLNPLSADLAHLKTRGTTPEERTALLEASDRITLHAEERRLAKKGPTMKYGREDLELFDIHMLLELDGIKEAISFEQEGFAREALKLVLSSILVKVSKKPGDTVERIAPRRLATGFAIRLFGNKTKELAERLEEFARLVPEDAPEARFAVDDARILESVEPGSVDLVICSPPYPGVYDYALHHALRLRWLGLDARPFETREIGARRHVRAASRHDAVESWRRDFGESLRAIRGVLAPRGAAVLVLADSVVQREPLYADDLMNDLTRANGLEVVAVASQRRPHFHGPTEDAFRRRARREHVFVLLPDGKAQESRPRPARPSTPERPRPKVAERPRPKVAERPRPNVAERPRPNVAERPQAARPREDGPGAPDGKRAEKRPPRQSTVIRRRR